MRRAKTGDVHTRGRFNSRGSCVQGHEWSDGRVLDKVGKSVAMDKISNGQIDCPTEASKLFVVS